MYTQYQKTIVFDAILSDDDITESLNEILESRFQGSALNILKKSTETEVTWKIALSGTDCENFLLYFKWSAVHPTELNMRFLRRTDVGKWFRKYMLAMLCATLRPKISLTKAIPQNIGLRFHEKYGTIDAFLHARFCSCANEIQCLQRDASTKAHILETPENIRKYVWSTLSLSQV